MTIILIGYMGSGKSTIGQNLSKILNFEFLDLDAYIQIKEGQSIPELFKTKGEIYFRKIESQYLGEVLYKENTVISLGGGTPCYGDNMQKIKHNTNAKSVYLKATIFNLTERLFNEKDVRPLIAHLKTKEELAEFIGKHLFERSAYYYQSDITITVDEKFVSEITQEIVMELF
jgi:shikimate kinase